MNKDELILDILEKLHDKVDKLSEDVNDIKVQQARHDEVVMRHEARSTTLELDLKEYKIAMDEQVSILKKDAQFFRNFIVIMTGVGSVTLFLLKISPYLLAHL